MKKFYISSKKGISGICKYSIDFYDLILKEKGYQFIESSDNLKDIQSIIALNDHVHIEIGMFSKNEINILFDLLKANYNNISITLHDPPLVKYPFYEFKNQFLHKVSKFYDKYFNSGGAVNKYLKKIKLIYVLSHKGMEALKNRYKIENVQYLPHIVNINEIEKCTNTTNDFIYLGFIGKNKGIEYSLQLHQSILKTHPTVKYYIAGKALGHQIHYYNYLKEKYSTNVEYLGYVDEEKLIKTFRNATFAPILFNSYKFYQPFSGSILYSLKKGKIVLTNNVNATSELIEDGKNGFFLSGELEKDTDLLTSIFKNKLLQETIGAEVSRRLIENFSEKSVNNNFKN